MASGDRPVGELPAASSVLNDDLFVLEQNGEPKKLEGAVLLSYLLKAIDGHGGIVSIDKKSSSGLVDTYEIKLADGTTSSFQVTNGAKGDKGDSAQVWIKYANQEPTEESHTFGDTPDAWIGFNSGFSETAPTDWKAYSWFKIKGESIKGDVGATPKLQIGSVTSVEFDDPADASISGTPENPVLSLRIPRGRDGRDGEYSPDWAENMSSNPGFVLNRTHYVVSGEAYMFGSEVVFQGSDIAFLSTSDTDRKLNYNILYRVVFDGMEYLCRSRDIVAIEGRNTIAIGNISILDSAFDDTGEPFVFYILPNAVAGYLKCPGFTGRTVLITVYVAEVAKKLENKFLEAEWTATRIVRGHNGPILTERQVEFTGSSAVLNLFPNYGLENGAKYTVTWKGTEYSCVCYARDNTWYLGQRRLADLSGGEEVPFCFVSYGGSGAFVYKDTDAAETVTVKIDGHQEILLQKLPREFLPEVELSSPDGTRYRLTVSNSGALSTQKVT